MFIPEETRVMILVGFLVAVGFLIIFLVCGIYEGAAENMRIKRCIAIFEVKMPIEYFNDQCLKKEVKS